MRVLALVPSIHNTSPGQRFRIEQWEPFLRERGVDITFRAFESEDLHRVLYRPGKIGRKLLLVSGAFARRASELRSIETYDAVYLFREATLLGPAVFELFIARSGVPIIFDFDDAIFVPYRSPSNGYLSLLKFPSKTRTICRVASHIMAGNAYLADYARQVNSRVTIVPTTIDTGIYTVRRPRPEPRVPVVGWSGSYSTVQHLDTLRSALIRLSKLEKFRLRVIGAPRYELDGVEVEATDWRAETEVDDLRSIDIGVMPLPEDPWSRGKCGLKALQYMALSIPTICSPVGVNSEIIHDGVNGLLAASEDEWVERMRLLLKSARLRRELGEAGRKTVEERYSAAVQAPRVYDVFETAAREKRRARDTLS